MIRDPDGDYEYDGDELTEEEQELLEELQNDIRNYIDSFFI